MKKLLYILLLSLLSLPMAGQVVYQCDFEDEAERSQWELNPGNRASRCENWWYIGKAGDYSENGNYCYSYDGGKYCLSFLAADSTDPTPNRVKWSCSWFSF